MPSTPERVALRERGRAARRSIPAEHRQRFDHAIAMDALACIADAPDGPVALYRAYDGEVGTDLVAEGCARLGRQVVYALHTPRAPLTFVVAERWQTTRFGLPVPEGPVVDAEQLAVIVVPGTLFDRRGHRIGMGAGAYDRTLPDLPATRLGLAYECQLIDQISAAPWDQPLDLLVTEGGVHTFALR
ncbi:MAG: 5-formyltetrahydrofolate cyclo-ligase [Bradymonadia bacterium]